MLLLRNEAIERCLIRKTGEKCGPSSLLRYVLIVIVVGAVESGDSGMAVEIERLLVQRVVLHERRGATSGV
jgi:hypothetical protein